MKSVLLVISVLISLKAMSCECPGHDVDTLIKHADYAFIGKAIRNITPEVDLSDSLDQSGYGTTIEFQIIQNLKGSIPGEKVIIDQRGTDNCTQTFKLGSKYLVFGSPNKRMPSDSNMRYNDYITWDEMLKGVDKKRMEKFEKFYNDLRKKGDYVFTDGCKIYNSESKQFQLLNKSID